MATFCSLLLVDTLPIVLYIVLPIVGLAVGALAAWVVLKNVSKKKSEKKLDDTSRRVEEMLESAKAECKQIKKEAILEAKEQELKRRNEFEQEMKEKRAEQAHIESRLNRQQDALERKETELNRKNESLEAQKNNLTHKLEEVEKTREQVARQHELMIAELERVAQLSKDEAKKLLTEEILDETRRDAAVQVRNLEQQTKDEADMNAKNIISLAIQRCASDHASETTVSVVPLPNDDMKARIIGREGRNIRAIENATGIELIIDDTPEVVILSGFDPVRREVARLTLERLITDGRIHPARIEETVEKVTRELEQQIKAAGENAMFEVGIFGLHPEIIKLIGRLKFRTSYGQNVYRHSIEVAQLAGLMAQELGLDVNFAKRAGLLHDIGKAVDHEQEGTHIQIGADLAKKYKENAMIVNAIMAHHGDVEPKTIEAVLVQAADAISGARPGARRETGSNYVKRLEKLEAIAADFPGVDKSYAIQAGREVRVIVKPDQVDDAKALFLAKDIAKKIESELEYPGQIKVNVIREFRSVEYAK
ncbi:MAG: ribonuclease Y [Clostridiales bacterium]|nr:ribonuclease Y [Clostridiales bacterium]